MGLTKNLGWLSKYITAAPNGNISLGSDSGLGFQLLSETDNTRGLYMGYNYPGNYAQIEAVHQMVGYKNIVMNPNGGSILIGTSNPNAGGLLQVSSSADTTVTVRTGGSGNGQPGISFFHEGNDVFSIRGGASLRFLSSGVTERVRVTQGGNMLIGTQTDNGNRLNINGSLSATGTARANNFSPNNFVGVTAGTPSSATIPLGYSSISVAALCDGQWRPLLTNLNDVKAFCWVTMGDAASKDTGSYQMAFTNPSYGVNSMSNLTYSDNGWNTGSFGMSYDTVGGNIRLIMINTSYYSSSNYAYGTIHFLRLE